MGTCLEILSEGTVFESPIGTPSSVVTTGPRCVVGHDGGVICTFMYQSRLGVNDFVPVLTRSQDAELTSWFTPRAMWPELSNHYSIFGNLSRSPAGELFFFGSRTVIDKLGEPFWNEQTKGLKENDLIWSRSRDDGRTWSTLRAFPLPFPGTAEVPGPLLVTRHHGGRWIGVYSPYNSFDPLLRVERQRVIAVGSDDGGDTWHASIALTFDEADSGGAEAWVTELSDGRLLACAWQVDLSGRSRKYPNRYAISHDGGRTWSPTASTGITANTTALTPLPGKRAIFTTVRRGQDDTGIWLSVVRPTDEDFGVLADQRVWQATRSTLSGNQATHDNWTDFTYGEPCVAVLADGTLLVVFWYLDARNAGVRYLRVRMTGIDD